MLSDDLEQVRSKSKRVRASKKPRGYFHGIYLSPDDWDSLEELTSELAVRPYFFRPFFPLQTDISFFKQPFLELTKRLEGDGPTGAMVIPEFYALKTHLDERAEQLHVGDALLPMVASMQARVNRYFEEALQCNTTVMASLLNPHF